MYSCISIFNADFYACVWNVQASPFFSILATSCSITGFTTVFVQNVTKNQLKMCINEIRWSFFTICTIYKSAFSHLEKVLKVLCFSKYVYQSKDEITQTCSCHHQQNSGLHIWSSQTHIFLVEIFIKPLLSMYVCIHVDFNHVIM